MFNDELSQILRRELQTVRKELLAYPNEADIWATPQGIVNSAGTLAMHVVGNLQHFIGAQLGKSGYVRRRDAEFTDRDVPRAELLQRIDDAVAGVDLALKTIPREALESDFPIAVNNVTVKTRDWLMHLLSHLAYHLGQMDYHRRVVTGQREGLGALAISGLRTARAD